MKNLVIILLFACSNVAFAQDDSSQIFMIRIISDDFFKSYAVGRTVEELLNDTRKSNDDIAEIPVRNPLLLRFFQEKLYENKSALKRVLNDSAGIDPRLVCLIYTSYKNRGRRIDTLALGAGSYDKKSAIWFNGKFYYDEDDRFLKSIVVFLPEEHKETLYNYFFRQMIFQNKEEY
jgi:hypothetical protein